MPDRAFHRFFDLIAYLRDHAYSDDEIHWALEEALRRHGITRIAELCEALEDADNHLRLAGQLAAPRMIRANIANCRRRIREAFLGESAHRADGEATVAGKPLRPSPSRVVPCASGSGNGGLDHSFEEDDRG